MDIVGYNGIRQDDLVIEDGDIYLYAGPYCFSDIEEFRPPLLFRLLSLDLLHKVTTSSSASLQHLGAYEVITLTNDLMDQTISGRVTLVSSQSREGEERKPWAYDSKDGQEPFLCLMTKNTAHFNRVGHVQYLSIKGQEKYNPAPPILSYKTKSTIINWMIPNGTVTPSLALSFRQSQGSESAIISSQVIESNGRTMEAGKAYHVSAKYKNQEIILQVNVSQVILSQETAKVNVGETLTLTAKVLPEHVTDPTIIWTSSDPSIATVSQEGEVQAVAEGIATITATSHNGHKASCKITAVAIPVSSVKIIPEEVTIMEGESVSLDVEVLPLNATYKALTWKSSNDNVATINNCTLKGVNIGNATITATSKNGIAGTCRVKVTPKVIEVKSIQLSSQKVTLEVGEEMIICATVLPQNATDPTVTWRSSNMNIASVQEGRVVSISKGTTTISAKSSNGLTAECEITVVDNGGVSIPEIPGEEL